MYNKYQHEEVLRKEKTLVMFVSTIPMKASAHIIQAFTQTTSLPLCVPKHVKEDHFTNLNYIKAKVLFFVIC